MHEDVKESASGLLVTEGSVAHAVDTALQGETPPSVTVRTRNDAVVPGAKPFQRKAGVEAVSDQRSVSEIVS